MRGDLYGALHVMLAYMGASKPKLMEIKAPLSLSLLLKSLCSPIRQHFASAM